MVKNYKTDNPMTKVVLRATEQIKGVRTRVEAELGEIPFMHYERTRRQRQAEFDHMTVQDFRNMANELGPEEVHKLIADYGRKKNGLE